MRLENHDTVAVVGGGPAGSFFAIHLLKESRRMNRPLEVIIIEKKKPLHRDGDPWHRSGCNSCAGGVSPRLNHVLAQDEVIIPDEVVQTEIGHIWLQSLWKNLPLRVPKGMRMCTVFRGSLPSGRSSSRGGLDAFLLEQAVRAGARIVSGEVLSIGHSPSGMPELKARTSLGDPLSVVAAFVAIATGVNAHDDRGTSSSPLLRSIRDFNPRYVPPKTRRTLLIEFAVGRRYLERNMHRQAHFIEYGLKGIRLEHIALVPKEDFLTMTLIGKRVDHAVSPDERRQIVAELLARPEVTAILPGIQDARVGCVCAPRMAVEAAKNPFADRLALVGDAVGSRLYKDGLYSAYVTASSLARTILEDGVDERSLARGYGPTVRWLTNDNRYGRLVFALSRLTFGTPVLSRILYQAFATELKTKELSNRPLGAVLWDIASGMADYRDILKGMFRYSTLRSILIGGVLVTLSNRLAELFFGLKWGRYGRYPTVILKEKRDAVKQSVASRLGIQLDSRPDFERMYVIKIKGSPEEVFGELGKLGERSRNYLNLRFVEVRRVRGEANEPGSVIEYDTGIFGLSLELLLVRVVPSTTLVYEVSERYADRGKLVFDVDRTKDRNCRLYIYTAFDFKKGRTLPGRVFWTLCKHLFPAYIHDVVWNHALCRIKENVERAGSNVIRRVGATG